MSDEQLASDAALQQFIDLSRLLTGFDRFELLGTGQAAFYYDWVKTHAAERFATLLATYGELPADAAQHSSFVETHLLRSEKLSTLVRSIIKLWYLGQWYSPDNPKETQIPSANSYQQGLVWDAIHAHPQGAKQQGFGAWSEPPVTSSTVVKL
ncbi:sorbitol dehydrogenase family protein [Serratia fonticola]|uniref:sorbitol dehydrogenase family protein n=1 Tax=Serratia fonticola TaxID=47917 RepID=UPI0021781FBD|nr:sorbitol dehydrogenase family protein [Serratia fonticola]CAI0940350.1 Membrane bound FAD containing D-sorbitol dehydrogenase [Serratia fonticola]CAI1215349.1 Membrane bound FAD containing D-sorbitol dehydrogenase [Serratia fonticola]CAI1525801.1 Membrane bound FAD containing D-sorbitol dehydrogenase [Serratia fonticola]CAI2031629.1 Membrane bound FAD containing D-sorbitol dehydrogenase [Serratia fonticola]